MEQTKTHNFNTQNKIDLRKDDRATAETTLKGLFTSRAVYNRFVPSGRVTIKKLMHTMKLPINWHTICNNWSDLCSN